MTSADNITKLPRVLMYILRRTGPTHGKRFTAFHPEGARRMAYDILHLFLCPSTFKLCDQIPLNLAWTAVESNLELLYTVYCNLLRSSATTWTTQIIGRNDSSTIYSRILS